MCYFFSETIDSAVLNNLCILHYSNSFVITKTWNITPPNIMSWADSCQKFTKFANGQSQTKSPQYQCTYHICWKSFETYSSYYPETKIWMYCGQITLSKINEIRPLAILKQISTISMYIPSLVKICWYLLTNQIYNVFQLYWIALLRSDIKICIIYNITSMAQTWIAHLLWMIQISFWSHRKFFSDSKKTNI